MSGQADVSVTSSKEQGRTRTAAGLKPRWPYRVQAIVALVWFSVGSHLPDTARGALVITLVVFSVWVLFR